MKARTVLSLVAILCLNLLLAGVAAAGNAAPPYPLGGVAASAPPRVTPSGVVAASAAPDVALGQRAQLSGMCGRSG